MKRQWKKLRNKLYKRFKKDNPYWSKIKDFDRKFKLLKQHSRYRYLGCSCGLGSHTNHHKVYKEYFR